MQQTPKLNKKLLSLANKKNSKQSSESSKRRNTKNSQNNVRNSTESTSAASAVGASNIETPGSPSVISISSDYGIECTPPPAHKRLNLDDSTDYSPHSFDSSFSPCNLLSQTLAIDSPEVGWHWGSRSKGGNASNSLATPDSAYANDSSYSSGIDSNGKEKAKNHLFRSLNYELKRVETKRSHEMEIRRAEKTKAEELLKKRCARLQEQLKEAELRSKCNKNISCNKNNNKESLGTFNTNLPASISNFKSLTQKTDSLKKTPIKNDCKSSTKSPLKTIFMKTPQKSNVPAAKTSFDDFFEDDSDIDGFLLEATQQCESKITECYNKDKKASEVYESPKALNSLLITPKSTIDSSTKSQKKEKRTSLYMQLLEDDFNDDWFASLDEDILKATQPKKPRTSLQRYKSMPSETTSDATGSPLNTKSSATSIAHAESPIGTPKFKRHASSYAISPCSTHQQRPRQKKL